MDGTGATSSDNNARPPTAGAGASIRARANDILPAGTTRQGTGKHAPTGLKPLELGYGLRLMLALGVVMLVVATVHYQLSAQAIKGRALEEGSKTNGTDAARLEEVFNDSLSSEDSLARIQEYLVWIAGRSGVAEASLIDNQYEQVVASSDPVRLHATKTGTALQQVFASGDGYSGALLNSVGGPAGEPGYEYMDLVNFPATASDDGKMVLNVITTGDALDKDFTALRVQTILLLLVGFIVGGPIIYLMGGRSLSSLHRWVVSQSNRDGLTELKTHRAFQDEIGSAIALALRYDKPLSLALFDLDNFKLANDRHGHRHGDWLLKEFSSVLEAGRASDRAFRIGGDEFALLLPYTELEAARVAVDRIRVTAERRLTGVTVSVGMATLKPDGAGADALQERADAALYEAKRLGRNKVMSFEEIAGASPIVTEEKTRALQRLLADKRLDCAFQPIWSLEKDSVIGYEALARPWAEYGFAGPMEAFDVAEAVGRAAELDRLCRSVILSRASELPEDALLFINVLPNTLDQATLSGDKLLQEAQAAGVPPERIVLEITERLATSVPMVVREATRLGNQGFRLAIDDVGAGNSGLEMLRELPVDFIKIDREVVARAQNDMSARGVFMAIVAFAEQTQAFVIAEGIETEAILDFVRRPTVESPTDSHGVQGAQGYLLGMPAKGIPADSSDLVRPSQRTSEVPA